MERLEPILKQKFWILLGLGIVMTITGWWMATGTLAATIADRTKAVESAFSMIPSGEIPNTDWTTKLAARNLEQDRAVRYTRSLLWERQRSRMTWPDTVAQFAWQNGYRGEIGLAGRENYRTAYGFDVRRVWESVRPYNPLDGSGIVVFGNDQSKLPQRTWGTLAPSSAEMWDAQEDQWLLESLLQAIVSVNGGSEAQRTDAYVHVIETLELHGGQPAGKRSSGSSSSPGASAGGPGGAHGMTGPAGFGGPGPGGAMSEGGASGRGGMAAVASADFDWREELGDDGSSRGAGGFGGPGFGGEAAPSGPASAHGSGPGSGPGGPGSGAAASTVRRYVDDEEALPYKTRGFYMTVIMDHRKIPSLIAELSANERSAWPVEILRVQMVRLHDNDVDSRGGTGGMMAGGPVGMTGSGRPGVGYPMTTGATTPGFSPNSESDAPAAATFSDPTRADSQNLSTMQQAAAAAAALEAALQDPFMARVALCGVITLYKEVKPDPADAAAAGTAPGANGAAPAPAQTGATPADPAANPAATPVANPPGTPAATPEAAPAANPGATPAAPAAPGSPAAPAANPDPAGAAPAAPAPAPGGTVPPPTAPKPSP